MASTSVFEDLLGVQEHDTTADRLRHRRETMPELAQLAAVDDALAKVEKSLDEWSAQVAEVGRRQGRLEQELAAVEAKITELEARLYSGAVTVPRELQALQADIESIRRRRNDLEDQVLDAMTEREPLDEEVLRLESDRLDGEGSKLRAAIAEAQAEIDRQLAQEIEARTAAAAAIPTELATLYEQLRAKMGGVGAARLVNGRCSGCHLDLPATEVDRIRREPPDTLIRCDQCGRVLVR